MKYRRARDILAMVEAALLSARKTRRDHVILGQGSAALRGCAGDQRVFEIAKAMRANRFSKIWRNPDNPEQAAVATWLAYENSHTRRLR